MKIGVEPGQGHGEAPSFEQASRFDAIKVHSSRQ
jgi:hypothetical protein